MTSSPDARRFCIRVRAAGWPLAEVRPAPTAATPHSRRGQFAAPGPVMGFRRSWTARMLRTSNRAPGSNGQAPRSLVQDTAQPLKTLHDSGEYLPHSPQYCSLNNPDRLFEVDRRQRLGMPGTEWEVAHLAFHASPVTPIATRYNSLLENLLEHSAMERFPLLRGE